MTARHPSPQQIRSMAATAFRRRMRQVAPVLRQPEGDETPLSREEIALGVERGFIRNSTARVRVHFAREAA